MFVRALFVACLFGVALSRDFPDITVLNSFSTEVQLSLVKEQATVYAREYYSSIDKRGSMTVYMQGAFQSVYYDNETNEVLDVNKTYCKASEVDISDFTYTPLYHGWLNINPLIIGPSAPLFYALKNKDKLVEAGSEVVRNIPCDKWELKVQDKISNFTIQYYFAPEDWTTPYVFKKFTPIRIRIVGMSARYTANMGTFVDVDQITDFAYYKPSIDDLTKLQPPVGIGCVLRDETNRFPNIPEKFMFSAEKIDLLKLDKQDNVEIQFERVWYDYTELLARVDRYSKKKGYKSAFYDFKGGAAYYRLNDGSCQQSTLRDTELVVDDLGMTGRMMTPKEFLMLDGKFYKMGQRETRGIICDTFESVKTDEYYMGEKYARLVVTVYFIESFTKVGVNGEMLSQIPTFVMVNGWSTPTDLTYSKEYKIYGFDKVAWPPMYSSFGLEKCFTKPETKTYFVVVLEVPAKDAAKMEDQDPLIIDQLRTTLALHAKVPEYRIPFLKADYKSTGVYVSGVLLERAPALLQFFPLEKGEVQITKDPDLKSAYDAKTLEECSYACIDEGDFPCKGFYFCNKACFLKSTDPFSDEEGGKETNLGVCDEYIRTHRDSTTFREAYLSDALGYLESAILNGTVKVEFQIPNGDEIVTVQDIVIGDGPYSGVDAGDKPFVLSIESRKLDAGLSIIQSAFYTTTLTDCYKQCKDAGSACSSFSFCPDSTKDDKECLFTSELLIKGVTPDDYLKPDTKCNIYRPKFLDYYLLYPGKLSFLPGEKSIRSVTSLEKCAENCRREKDFVCRGFEYCSSMKTCTLHKKHILDHNDGESISTSDKKCVHYAARYIADYMNRGAVLIEDESNVRFGTSLDECAKICSEELKEDCRSFNYCPSSDFTDSTCSLSKKLLNEDGITTTEKDKCQHFEKRDSVHDWDKSTTKEFSKSGYTKKGFVGLVFGTLVFGLIVGAIGFVIFSYFRSKSSGDGLAVKFMKSET